MTNLNNNVTNKVNTRNMVLNILHNIFVDKAYTNIAIDKYLNEHNYLSKKDRAFITRIVEGTVENQITIDYIINQFSKTKTSKMKNTILIILRLSVYQIKYMDKVPMSAICNEAVKLTKKRKFNNLSGFVNGVLRNIGRNVHLITFPDEKINPIEFLSVTYSFPKWLIKMWLSQYDYETVKQICENSNKTIKTNIRCNLTKTNTLDLRKELEKNNIEVENSDIFEYAFKISNYDNIRSLQSFVEGKFSVQDESSMLVGHLASVQKNDTVIDVCAAPGGKTTHVAEKLQNTGCVYSRDIYTKKLNLIKENVKRLQLNNIIVQKHSALDLDKSLKEKADIVIADVPCSGLGIIRKKPDIKYNMTKENIDSLVSLQRDILNVVYQYVKVDGILMYSTCTINPQENIDNIKWFIDKYPEFKLVDIREELPNELNSDINGCIQLLPGFNNTDGFFIAKLRRVGI
ncbi:MAG: 16S rRNA (cytosine(967)-C(5))-methyltransferase RsmB [Vallitalea sp.]|nr:16S rRNA (cytosine(967)-C(5))-methyltransferase RsmB [Vallitalea sp.]